MLKKGDIGYYISSAFGGVKVYGMVENIVNDGDRRGNKLYGYFESPPYTGIEEAMVEINRKKEENKKGWVFEKDFFLFRKAKKNNLIW